MQRKALIVSFVLFLIFPAVALPWGSAPTHMSVGNDVVLLVDLPSGVDTARFIRANNCPDLAQTLTFIKRNLGYVHSREFAESLFSVARRYGVADWLATAWGFGAHLAADEVAHGKFVPSGDPTHALVEAAVDTIIYYNGSPLAEGLPYWEQYNVDGFSCSPYLMYYASRHFRRTHPGANLIYPWHTYLASKEMAVLIDAEFAYIRLKGNDNLSRWYLDYLEGEGIIPGSFEPYYQESVEAAVDWITGHPYP